jgi:hypothetical protein
VEGVGVFSANPWRFLHTLCDSLLTHPLAPAPPRAEPAALAAPAPAGPKLAVTPAGTDPTTGTKPTIIRFNINGSKNRTTSSAGEPANTTGAPVAPAPVPAVKQAGKVRSVRLLRRGRERPLPTTLDFDGALRACATACPCAWHA